MCVNCRPLIKAIDAYIQKVDSDLSEELEMQGFLEPEKTVEYMQDIEDGVAEALLEETDYILSEAEKAIDLETFAEDIWPGVKLNDTVKDKLITVFTENLDKFMPEFVEYYIAQTDKDLTLLQVSKRTTAWVKNWSKDLGDIMKLNSHKEIERILEKGLKDGKGIAAFTREILDSGIRDEYYKARRVAITEVLRAHSVAQQEAFMQSPAVTEKMWKHTGSYRNDPRQNHIDMNDKHVPVNEPFELDGIKGGTHHPMYPRDTILPPEESINCHCICQPVVDEDILGLSLEERQRLQQEAIDEMDDEWEKELDAKNKAKAGIDEEKEKHSSGGKFDIGTYEWEMSRNSQAEKYYEKIRETDDIKAISESSGMSENDIEQIKNHVFHNKHKLYDGTVDKFDPDYDMAVAWKRLTEGIPEDRDILLLKHELLESQMEKEYNLTAAEAHKKATETYDWAGKIDEILGQGGEDNDLL